GNHAPEGLWSTTRVVFDRQAGWNRPRAEEWVSHHLGVRDPGRTVCLAVPHRMHPDLAAFLADLLFPGAYHSRPASAVGLNGCSSQVEFLTVPPLAALAESSSRPEKRRFAGPGRPPSLKGGAGLELDLADRRHRDRLPAELRPLLPGQGLVNFLEAQAVVRALENLTANLTKDPSHSGAESEAVIGVLALYPAQAELIRHLVKQSPRLAAAPADIRIDVPGAFRERECLVTLLSLTRSHAHRAVSFGEGPHILALALTRARAKLVLVGDPGTLARRCQWQGPVDHLDENASARERELISRLVRYLQGQGPHQQAFHLCEGGGV
ncbi:MAG: hypothetical protein JO112_10245, partial [Planctomycetes bacterium]|nr:hypothetical protein [Planctomycetota bacterium]